MKMKIAPFKLFLISLIFRQTIGQECASDGTCDTHERCAVWKDEGECYRNADYMKKYCGASCLNVDKRHTRNACKDAHPRCPVWAKKGECQENPALRNFCAKSCDTCTRRVKKTDDSDSCKDEHENCGFWAEKGECTNNPNYMLKSCAKSCGSCTIQGQQKLKDMDSTPEDKTTQFGKRQEAKGSKAKETLKLIAESVEYMKSADVQTLSAKIRDNCKNKHNLCSFWAVLGECEANKSFMKTNCAPACQTCHLIDMSTRCPPLEDAVPALGPGDLNKMFERIVATAPGNRTLSDDEREKLAEEGMTDYSVVVHSRPSQEPASETSLTRDKELPPWVIVFNNFLTPEECDSMIQLGYKTGYKRSKDVGKQNIDGSVDGRESNTRTSENAWCSIRDGCRDHEVPTRLHKRMSQVMGIPPENSEDLQVLKYEVGQFYGVHHDYIPHQKTRQCGPRILTFFMYLSDVEGGGGTNFPDLDLTIMPGKGKALLWPSVLDSEPMGPDERTRHQALPVEQGTKFAANGWIHMFDYVGPQEIGCN